MKACVCVCLIYNTFYVIQKFKLLPSVHLASEKQRKQGGNVTEYMRTPHLHTLLNETKKKSEETESHQIIDVLFKVWIMKNLHFAYAMLQENENKYKSVLKNPLQTCKTKSVSQAAMHPRQTIRLQK